MSWGVLEPSWERFGAVLKAFVRLGSVLGPCLFFGVDFGVILDAILDHFGVDFGSNFRPFWGDEDDNGDGDDDDDDVHVRRNETRDGQPNSASGGTGRRPLQYDIFNCGRVRRAPRAGRGTV